MIARSYLYVPADRPQVLAKASTRGADAVIADLEDAVRPGRKGFARETVVSWLRSLAGARWVREVWVRLNAEPEMLADDLAALATAPPPTGVVIAKTEGAEVLERLDAQLPPPVQFQPLVETARGVLTLADIASGPRVSRIQLGEVDLTADLGMDPEVADEHLGAIRLQVVTASAAARLDPAVAPVSTDLDDLARFQSGTLALRQMGFGGRATIHPSQVEVVNAVFIPTPDEVKRAHTLLAAAERATREGVSVFVDGSGRMVDEAVLRSARRILARAEDNPR